jgi:hypothetical protein
MLTTESLSTKPDFFPKSRLAMTSTSTNNMRRPYLNEIYSLPLSRSEDRSIRNRYLSSMISRLMTKNLGIKYKIESETVFETNTQKYFKLREKKRKIKLKRENPEVVDLYTDDPEYLKYESKDFSPNLGSSMTIQRYMGQNAMKKRKQTRFMSKLARF